MIATKVVPSSSTIESGACGVVTNASVVVERFAVVERYDDGGHRWQIIDTTTADVRAHHSDRIFLSLIAQELNHPTRVTFHAIHCIEGYVNFF